MNIPRLAALAVVARDGHLLLVRRRHEPDAGLWGFPGGHVEFGERIGDAACRELFEETGVTATPGRILTGLDTIIEAASGGIAYHFYLVAVECAYVEGTPEGRDDVFEAAWVPHDDILERRLPMSEDVDTLLKLVLAAV